MWICLHDGFYSIVAHRDQPGKLLVRARRPGDIERLLPGAKVTVTPQADYRYRTTATVAEVQAALAKAAAAIDYPNFKARVTDLALSAAYGDVWAVMARIQS